MMMLAVQVVGDGVNADGEGAPAAAVVGKVLKGPGPAAAPQRSARDEKAESRFGVGETVLHGLKRIVSSPAHEVLSPVRLSRMSLVGLGIRRRPDPPGQHCWRCVALGGWQEQLRKNLKGQPQPANRRQRSERKSKRRLLQLPRV
ncbi:MAG: hypothetical protein WDW38_004831 [Sanguina aurantia]